MKAKHIYTLIYKLIVLNIVFALVACSDFIEVDTPKTEIVSSDIFENDESANAAINGIYSLMMTNTSFTTGGLEEYTGIASDELICYSTSANRLQFYQNSLTSLNSDVLSVFWREAYRYINNANIILEGLQKPNGLTAEGRRKVEGEALFIRSFCHFYLANLFGKIPYVTSSSYELNASIGQSSFDQVMVNIEADLEKARQLMTLDFSEFNEKRFRPNRDAATALLARAYLYHGNWSKAEAMATAVITNTVTYSLQSDLNKVFLANSKESIWQLMPVIPSADTPQGQLFILSGAPNSSGRRVSMTAGLSGAFETGDQRKVNWVGTFTNTSGSWSFVYKYKKVSTGSQAEYSTVFRLAEQYLIRAEARVHLNDLAGASSDLNVIRNRAGLSNTLATTQDALLIAVERERRVELFGEFAHRWFDLQRTGRVDVIMSAAKAQWQTTDALFPIPNSEIVLNPNLSQNPGY